VLILRSSWQAWEGDIRHRNRQYIVEHLGAELKFQDNQVLCLCQDWADAYNFLKSRIEDDVKGHIKLARWCSLNQLPKEALDEAEAALTLNTENKEAKILCIVFEKMLKQHIEQASKPPPPQTPEAPPEIEIDPDLETVFSKQVQPILLNVCFECHNPAKTSKFELRNPERGPKKEVTLRNLDAVLKQLDREKPARSRLLEKATEAHNGIGKSPFRSRFDPNYCFLDEWVTQVVVKPWVRPPGSIAGGANIQTEKRMFVDPDQDPAESVFLEGKIVSTQPPWFDKTGSFTQPKDGVKTSNVDWPTPGNKFAIEPTNPGRLPPPVLDSGSRLDFMQNVPCFPDIAPMPRLRGTIVRTNFHMPAELLTNVPPFPRIAPLPRELSKAVRMNAPPLIDDVPKNQPAAGLPGPAAGPMFHFHPVPEPTIEATRPEPTSDEFDPRLFPSK
jgi:hypothetical protein